MSKFQIVRNAFIVLLIAGLILHIYTRNEAFLWAYVTLILIFLVLVILGSVNMKYGFFVEALTQPPLPGRKIAITFDDGPNSVYTPEILGLLKKHRAVGSFFCIGEKVRKNPEIIKQMVLDGHAIGNHSYSHSNKFPVYSVPKMENELYQTNKLLKEITTKKVRIFRPPFGVTNPLIAKAVKACGMKVVGWNVRSLDTTTNNYHWVTERVLKKIKPGAVILLHDDRKNTIKILESILLYAKQNHLSCVDVYDLFNIERP